MKRIFLVMVWILIVYGYGHAQVFQVDTIQNKGDKSKRINIVILGDGYTAAEQTKFLADATGLSNYLFTQAPFSNYINYFNVFAIRVISAESGVKHPNTAADCAATVPAVPVSNPNNYFGSTFDVGGIHRLVVPSNTTAIINVLAANVPVYDQALIVANSTYYGGSGGQFATSTIATASNEISVHEIGHSFATLADEYYAGDIYVGEKANMTAQSNPTLVKWKNWVGVNGIGVNQHCCGGLSPNWYKPFTNCKMEFLNKSFCSVCTQTLIEKIHSLVKPVAAYTPVSLAVNLPTPLIDFTLTDILKPVPNTLKTQWKLDGAIVSNNTDVYQVNQTLLSLGNHSLVATVIDSSDLLKVDNHATVHVQTISWTITKSASGIQTVSNENNLRYSLFPNPASAILNIAVEMENPGSLSIQIVSNDGRILEQVSNESNFRGKFSRVVNIDHLAKGTYQVVFKVGDMIRTERFVKE